jgi:hypothetical protein
MSGLLGNIETRLRRLEEQIGSITDSILQFMAVEEKIGFSDTYEIYSRDVNDSFLVGTSKVGVDKVGDRRDQPVLLYSS